MNMSNVDLTSFLATIITGVASVVLGIFAIWLSKHFDQKSSAALMSIQELATEIRSLVEVSVSQQEGFSSKMLDSILARDMYGVATEENIFEKKNTYENSLRKELKENEKKILLQVEEKIRDYVKNPSNLQGTLDLLRTEIRGLTEQAVTTISASTKLPSEVIRALEKCKEYPAHYILLMAIIKEGLTSVEQMESLVDKYHFLKNWERGVLNLLKSNIIQGDTDHFIVPNEYKGALESWIDINWEVLMRLMEIYKDKTVMGVTEEERAIANHIEFL
jgi:hypothetical protein